MYWVMGHVPLVHGEQHKVDLCLYDPATALDSVRDHANNARYSRDARILAGVQIEYPPDKRHWEEFYNPAVERLMNLKQLDNAYLVIFAVVWLRRKGQILDRSDWFKSELDILRTKMGSQRKDKNLNVYCVPGDPSGMLQPVWIRSIIASSIQ